MTDTTHGPNRVTGPGGECRRCKQDVDERILVGIQEVGSGPSRSVDACIPCARILALSPLAPPWLRTDLAAYDRAQSAG